MTAFLRLKKGFTTIFNIKADFFYEAVPLILVYELFRLDVKMNSFFCKERNNSDVQDKSMTCIMGRIAFVRSPDRIPASFG